MPKISRKLLVGTLLFLTACSAMVVKEWDEKYGKPDVTKYDVPATPKPLDVPYHQVQQVIESRCTVCHSCFDAPCQLKLTAWEGIARGATTAKVYDGERFSAAPTTRLFEDAFGASQWRGRGFHPVLNERPGQNNINGSLLAQMLMLKDQNPTPACKVLPRTFDVSIDRSQTCPTIENFAKYAANTPLWGMPFGLPGLKEDERNLILRWVQQGAPREPEAALPAALLTEVGRWEKWLNADDLKRQLVARYIYEHLFLAHLHFGDDKHFFRLVRSKTAPGQAVDVIATRRPYDDPGVARPYYRIVPLQEAVVSKTHMPYLLDSWHMKLWQRWFVDAPFTVTKLPSYEPETAANPFVSFVDIPSISRYRFMLEESMFTIMGFIKGPVCRGQIALDVIDDHFWVFFSDPTLIDEADQAQFLADNSQNLRLPSELESDAPVLSHWKIYADAQKNYLDARTAFVKNTMKKADLIRSTKRIWDGTDEFGRKNPNASLTVFRHFDNATVAQGLLGNLPPQTAWIINYPLLERIHYLLVAGFDVYGNIGHQLKSRLYMDFLRIEGEQNFLSMLPTPAHQAVEMRWYREAPRSTMDFVEAAHLPAPANVQTDLSDLADLTPQLAYRSLLEKLRGRVSASMPHDFDLQNLPKDAPLDQLTKLGAIQGQSLQWLPQTMLIKLTLKSGKSTWLSLINNSAHKNVAQLFFESSRRLPAEDTVSLVRGFLGDYPNAIWSVNEDQLPDMIQKISNLAGEKDYSTFLDDYGVRRTNPNFWAISDEAHAAMRAQGMLNYGILDYNRLENR